ncbi:MAG: hypothetical protein J7J25_03420 [Candidatus Omnitrophica bacterium]|nr:hypothetical protein [Candidatus Omnitrophota bacterium]
MVEKIVREIDKAIELVVREKNQAIEGRDIAESSVTILQNRINQKGGAE